MTIQQELTDLKSRCMAKKREVIFDNDGGDVFYYSENVSAENLLASRTKPALDAGLDTYVYTTGWGFGIGLHNSTVGSMLTTKRGIAKDNKTGDYAKMGTDCLRITADYVKARGKEFFWGMRMNDTHDAGYEGIHFEDNRFKIENPDILLGKNIKHGAPTAVDYASEKVRAFGVKYISEVIDSYNPDGVMLDFFRHPVFFRSTGAGLKSTDHERECMTSFIKNVYEAINDRRIRDKKYYLISIRVPDSVEYSYDIGLDLIEWFERGYIDILFVSSYLQFNRWEYSVETAHKYGIPVYPSLDESRVRSEFPRYKRNCLPAYLGRIMNVWSAGCDGVLMFNNSGLRDPYHDVVPNDWFDKDSGDFRLALEATMKGKTAVNTMTKRYFTSFRGSGRVAGGALPHMEYIKIPVLNKYDPIYASVNEKSYIPIVISDDFKNVVPKVLFTVMVSEEPSDMILTINGYPVEFSCSEFKSDGNKSETIEYMLQGELSIDIIGTGENMFCITGQNIIIYDLWLDLIYDNKRQDYVQLDKN